MVFSRTLINLEWTTIEEQHLRYWEKLQAKYKLSPDPIESPESLDDLARQCIGLCRKHLFSEPGTSIPGWKIGSKHGISCVGDLEKLLTPALCDHLIVTFAHQFYCDNLESRDIRECLATVYDCQSNLWKGTLSENDKDFQREQKKDFFNSNFRKYQNYCDGILNFIEKYKSWICQLHIQDEGNCLSSGTKAMLSQEFAAFNTYMQNRNPLAAPDWLFTVVMANNWKNHPFSIKKKGWTFVRDYAAKENLAERLANFLGGNAWAGVLLPEKPIFQKPKKETRSYLPLGLKESETPYVSIPFTPNGVFSKRVPAQKYNLLGSQEQVTIPVDAQIVFNNYLLEQHFHGYAIAVVLDRIKARVGDSRPDKNGSYGVYLDQYFALPFAIRLHAPLVHPELIRVIDAVISQAGPTERDMDCLSWLDWFIFFWNFEALPVLEELFLWGIYSCFDFDRILSEIETSLAARWNRLNRYRLVSTADTSFKEFDRACTPMMNEIVKDSYLAGLGMRYGYDPYTGVRVDLGMRTVFND